MPAKKSKTAAVPPTTMRIPEALLKGCGRIAKRKERSRSWIINDYIRQGLTRDGETVPQPTAGALD